MMKLFSCIICIFLIVTTANSQKLGKHTLEEWQTIIDTTWGEGLSTEKKLEIFDLYWNEVDAGYAGFNNLDVDWDALKNKYRPEVEAGVSRGRFAAIMNQLAMALMEIHTHCNDLVVRGDSLPPGVPLLAHGMAYTPFDQGHFGACLTPLYDSTALVHTVVSNHPLGLEPGDIVLGYEGLAWKHLYQQLLDAEFPIIFPHYFSVGTSKRSVSHMWLMSPGLNWHLFETIDILKYGTNDTVHLPTSSLENQNMHLCASTEQLPVPGVPMVDLSKLWEIPMVSWGIVENTQIGYIYVSLWQDLEGPAFTNAVDSLLNNYQTSGLILDFRTNPGGRTDNANGGFSRLFNSDLEAMEYAKRSDPDDHFALVPTTTGFCSGQTFRFHADPYLYDKPIAVLTGPMTISHAEVTALKLKFHPMTRFFGKPTNGGLTCFYLTFQNVIENNNSYPDWEAGYAPHNVFLADDPGNYLLHKGVEVDEEIWLTQEDVKKGEDTVVKRAIEWIQNLAYAHDVMVDKTYLRPGLDSVMIIAMVENPNNHDLDITAYISAGKDSLIDSLSLLPVPGMDNNHWRASYFADSGKENTFFVDVKTENSEDSTLRKISDVAWFTSIGPVKLVDTTHVEETYNARYRSQYFKLLLQNEGQLQSATKLTVQLSTDDSRVIQVADPVFVPDIAPGEVAISNKTGFQYAENYGPDSTINNPIHFTFTIYSDGYPLWKDSFSFVTPIGEAAQQPLPLSFRLDQNYPNPFNPSTTIEYQIPKTCQVDLNIYNTLGQKVTTLVSKKQTTGYYEIEWNASNFASGIYYYRLETDQGFVETKKLIVLK